MIKLSKSIITTATFAATLLSVGALKHTDAASLTIKQGDTASELANTHHTSLAKLQELNPNVNLSQLSIGQSLKISNPSSKSTYKVKSGDTLSKIANRFNTSVATLKTNNNLTSDLIYVGQTLKLKAVQTENISYNQVQAPTKSYTPKTSNKSYSTYTPRQATTNYQSNVTGSDSSAKAWIANKESTNNYSASNGQYYGKYQLAKSSLNGDYSAANQEKAADKYVASRYGSWSAAKAFHQSHGWY